MATRVAYLETEAIIPGRESWASVSATLLRGRRPEKAGLSRAARAWEPRDRQARPGGPQAARPSTYPAEAHPHGEHAT